MATRKPACAKILDDNLEELRRRSELESLRKFLIEEKCFPPQRNPHTAAITMDELKKLARAWKLHERRNFWKSHPSKNEMTIALLQYIQDNNFQDNSIDYNNERGRNHTEPSPPHENKPSTPTARSKAFAVKALTEFYRDHKILRNDQGPEEIVSKSRYFQFSKDDNQSFSVIDTWKMNEYDISTKTENKGGVGTKSLKVAKFAMIDATSSTSKIEKYRGLSRHLVRFSADAASTNTPIDRKSLEALFQLTDSEDLQTLANCIISISNISSVNINHALLLELKVISKISQFSPMVRYPNALLATGLVYYYLSGNRDVEDNIWNTAMNILQHHCTTDDPTLLQVTLFTLNNLLPCLDRLRITELMVNIFQSRLNFHHDRESCHHVLSILLNASVFTNTHHTLFDAGITTVLSKIAAILAMQKGGLSKEDFIEDIPGYNKDSLILSAVINNLLYSPDHPQQTRCSSDYERIFVDLVSLRDPLTTADCMHSIAVLSCSSTMIRTVCQPAIVNLVSAAVRLSDLSANVNMALHAAKYYANISKPGLMDPKVIHSGGGSTAIILLTNSMNITIQSIAVTALLNILTDQSNCLFLVDEIIEPLLSLIENSSNMEASKCIFNLTCDEECGNRLVINKVHLTLLRLILNQPSFEMKSSLLLILVQLSNRIVCVHDLIQVDLIHKLLEIVKLDKERVTWHDVAKLLLSIAMHQFELRPRDRDGMVKLLNRLCMTGKHITAGFQEEVVSKAAIVLAFLSLAQKDFSDLENVLRTSMCITHSDVVMESTSTALYNIVCTARNVDLLLKDGIYLNVMVKMMRNGNPVVQENISQVMRNLSAIPKCVELLLQLQLLSDFIVIALLRTSSDVIKLISCDTFFNMLCHSETRSRLIKGDLWWAMIRLTRTDVHHVRSVAVNTLFNLSTDSHYIRALRDSFVFNFIKEILSYQQSHYLEICLYTLQNILHHCSEDLEYNERVSLIRVCQVALRSSSSIQTCRNTLQILRRACLLCDTSQDVAEFIQLDLIDDIYVTRAHWKDDNTSKLYLSQILCHLSNFDNITKSFSLAELGNVLNVLLAQQKMTSFHINAISTKEKEPAGNKVQKNFMRYGEGSYRIISILYNYIHRNHTAPKDLLSHSSWRVLVSHMFTKSAQAAITEDETVDVDNSNLLTNTKVLALSVYAYCLQDAANLTVEIVRPDYVLQLFLSELPSDDSTTMNMMIILQAFSVNMDLSKALFASTSTTASSPKMFENLENDNASVNMNARKIVRLLNILLISRSQTDSTVYEQISTILRNLSLHKHVIATLVSCKGIDVLIRNIMGATSISVFVDVCIFFYSALQCELQVGYEISPRFILMKATSICESVTDRQVSSFSRAIIGLVLDKYSGEMGYDIAFVQSMLGELNEKSEDISIPLTFLENMVIKTTPMTPTAPKFTGQETLKVDSTVDTFSLPDNAWLPIVQGEIKGVDVELQFPIESVPRTHILNCIVEPRPIPIFSKINKKYPVLDLDHQQFLKSCDASPNMMEMDRSMKLILEGASTNSLTSPNSIAFRPIKPQMLKAVDEDFANEINLEEFT